MTLLKTLWLLILSTLMSQASSPKLPDNPTDDDRVTYLRSKCWNIKTTSPSLDYSDTEAKELLKKYRYSICTQTGTYDNPEDPTFFVNVSKPRENYSIRIPQAGSTLKTLRSLWVWIVAENLFPKDKT